MGKKSGKPVKEKTRADFKIFLVSFSPLRHAGEALGAFKRNLGGSDPVGTFGRQNRTNTGVAPAQIEVFVRGLFSELIAVVCSSPEPCDEA